MAIDISVIVPIGYSSLPINLAGMACLGLFMMHIIKIKGEL